jgi:hypothetical protein
MADEPTREDYDAWVASQQGATQEDATDESGAPQETEDERIERAVQAALAKERERVAAASPQSLVPNHGGGIGVDNHETTWSQFDQEMAIRGEHPLQKS